MNRLTHRFATVPDVHHVGNNLRLDDLNEVRAKGKDPLDALLYGYLHGDRCYSLVADGEPIAIYGTARTGDQPKSASIWLLGTDGILKHRYEFLRISRDRVAEISKPYDLVWNFVDSRNELHIKWLRWLGFSFIRSTTQVSVDGTPFYEFAKLTNV